MNACPGCQAPVPYWAYWYRHESAAFECPTCHRYLRMVPGRRRKIWLTAAIPVGLLWSIYELNHAVPAWYIHVIFLAIWVYVDSRFSQFRLYLKPKAN